MPLIQPFNASAPNRLRWIVRGAAAGLLLLPLVAMQFTSEVNWTPSDFLVFAIMLTLACGAYEWAARASGNKLYRLAAGITVVGLFLQIWANGAVGIIGNEGHPANLMFLAVPVVALLGALVARLETRALARTLYAMAVVQAAIALAAWIIVDDADLAPMTVFTGLYVLIWLMCAGLFRKAAP